MAEETARSLLDALRAALLTVDREAELAIGGADLPMPCSATAALGLADGALAQAETESAFAVCIAAAAPADAPVHGQGKWQLRLTDALQAQRARLGEFEVRDPRGELLHLDCPMQLQLDAKGAFEAAPRWLAMAVRCRLVDQADRLALALALQAIAQDLRPRAVNVAAASLSIEGFIDEVRQQLQAAPEAAAKLWVDVAEAAALQPRRLREAIVAWQGLGVRIGLEHAGARLRELPRLHALGVHYVRIDGSFVQGVATQSAVRELARGLVTLLHGMQLQVLAEAVQDPDDLATLWALGFDGATGSALRQG
jgi:EAL domain-containing protein (putative c-di-GMP-specific phosphodiesterase class I)